MSHDGGAVDLEKVATSLPKINNYDNLYKLQYKAQQILKAKCPKEERVVNLEKCIKIHSRILSLIQNYE